MSGLTDSASYPSPNTLADGAISRRAPLPTLAVLPALSPQFIPVSSQAQSTTSGDPLPLWNDGSAKQAITTFVKETTDQASPKFVPTTERIATFDQDGTLWVEHPIYSQAHFQPAEHPARWSPKSQQQLSVSQFEPDLR